MNKKETTIEKTSAPRKKVLEGTVVSNKMDKTVVVSVDRFVKHSKYGKYMKKSSRLKAHDEQNEYETGDKVKIEVTRPISKGKSFRVVSKA